VNVVDIALIFALAAGLVVGGFRGVRDQLLRAIQLLLCAWGAFASSDLVARAISWIVELPPGRPRILVPYFVAFGLYYGILFAAMLVWLPKPYPVHVSRAAGALLGAAHAAGLSFLLLVAISWGSLGWRWMRYELSTSTTRSVAEVVATRIESRLAPSACTDLLRQVGETLP
jgi:hypothetical protein